VKLTKWQQIIKQKRASGKMSRMNIFFRQHWTKF